MIGARKYFPRERVLRGKMGNGEEGGEGKRIDCIHFCLTNNNKRSDHTTIRIEIISKKKISEDNLLP